MSSQAVSQTSSLVLSRSGDKMPIVGFGCWKVPKDITEHTVEQAIREGYRLFDGAADYGNEVEVGRGIANAIKAGVVTREELFVTTKLWNTYHKKEHVRLAFEKQLKDLGLDYVDLYLVHFPISLEFVPIETKYPPEWYVPGTDKSKLADNAPLHELWPEMEKLVDEGLARNIGVSNFNVQLIMDLWSYARIKPQVLQIEIHPYLPQTDLVNFVHGLGMQVTAYSTFGPASFVELEMAHAVNATPLFDHPVITTVASRHSRAPAQILLRWAVQRGLAIIPKTSNRERLKQNLDLLSFSLTDKDLAEIRSVENGLRLNNPPKYGIALPIFC
ncbi:putative NAD(P)H-dependent D-xylose reductase xyl1 [Endogone sp. FLAS-F59071]|nr:putative NAD(P)H-dependent D-xylose reductase xyl1 [Endogone sp. FLAS-F59071]|eukprot:RUS18876.1 putative NAD(P)H-dependent D-xylose reductase xyl1 [Endogone sp. FLAS-F59071]